MTPHLFKSTLFPGKWACCAKIYDSTRERVYRPQPQADIAWGLTPLEAYNEWMRSFG